MSLQRQFVRGLCLSAIAAVLAACAAPSNAPTPSPLPKVKNTVNAAVEWRASAGSNAEFLRFLPANLGDLVIVAGAPDKLTAYKLTGGGMQWRVRLEKPVAGGVGAGNGIVVVGTLKGVVYAFDANGKPLWNSQASSEIVAPPAVADDVVLIRTGDGKISALSSSDGSVKWQYSRQLPSLTLRNYAPFTVSNGVVFAGLPAGHLAALSTEDGRVLWDTVVSQPKGATEVERVADIVSAPLLTGGSVCAASYQGRVACFDPRNGSTIWSREASSYSGVAFDGNKVFLTDDQGHVRAYERETGRSVWDQDKLVARIVSAPAVVGGYVAVGDLEGYVHLLNEDDGSFVAQLATDGSRIAAAPQTFSDHLILQSQKGDVFSVGIK
ncbi:outer membrane protein assembly factor BamB [Silvimonas amylolytica]|uniref:Outer membrane protein assembly factor BamB n=1 Tax=Silvimonas amylolytica TaxID=449663 RepID=A0ABQ2PQ87_9NEIS|nr:outer membrane protein assembly factor BamB [Silvimonas amylolytica]GGP27551.1 outer membrane protein assembly factor BamB [Silvimonas amylolytica]